LIQQPVAPTAAELTPLERASVDAVTAPVQGDIHQDLGDATTAATPTLTYLDLQHRYQLLDPLPSSGFATEVQVRVLDCQPFQVSPLEALSEQQLNPDSSTPTQNDASIQSSSTAEVNSLKAIAVPTVARPYLALQSRFYQTLPIVHDAWCQDGQEIVLLENRSHLPLLLELWRDDQILPLQIVYWLHEMAELWAALEVWQCRQSLLELTNLRVDEDQILCLQRLYFEPEAFALRLTDLGQLWQTLFDQSQRTQIGSFALLLRDLQAGDIQTAPELQSRLEAIAHELQANSTATAMISQPPDSGSADPSTVNATPSLEPATPESTPAGVPPLVNPAASPSTAPTSFDLSNLLQRGDEEGDDMPTVVLPMRLVSLEEAGRTDVGRQRNHNEDYFSIDTKVSKRESPSGRTVDAQGLYILCDGMGGHASGEVASALAVNTLKQYFQENWLNPADGDPQRAEMLRKQLPTETTVREAVRLANQAIYDVNQQNARSGSGRMGTTLVAVLVHDTAVAIAHVGDSRLYRFSRKRGLEQITIDHEVGQREIQRGVEPAIAYARPDAYQLTQALGPRDEDYVNPDVQFLDLNEDTLLMLCSDGLSDNDLLETHWRTHLEPLLSSQANLDQGVRQLIDLANQYNGHDNITAIVVRIKVRPNLEQLR
jgi:serine/threonine protein phosphatase PrpC